MEQRRAWGPGGWPTFSAYLFFGVIVFAGLSFLLAFLLTVVIVGVCAARRSRRNWPHARTSK